METSSVRNVNFYADCTRARIGRRRNRHRVGTFMSARVSPISIYTHQAHLYNSGMLRHPGRARAARICVNLRHYLHLQCVPAPVFSPTGTALALKSGNSCIRRVRKTIPAVPFFDISTTTYAAVIRSVQAYGNSDEQDGLTVRQRLSHPGPVQRLKKTAAQLLADAVPPHVSIRTHSHYSQVTGTASVFHAYTRTAHVLLKSDTPHPSSFTLNTPVLCPNRPTSPAIS